jgi:hypothetical protein
LTLWGRCVSVLETVRDFVLIPAAIVLVVGGLAYAFGGGQRRGKRYRPGRPYDVAPVWFLSSPERVEQAERKRAIADKPQPPALPTGEIEVGRQTAPQGSTGGASDRW